MLITFKSKASGSITMFADVAKTLLKMMGQSGESPGAILAADVPAALARLKAAVAAEKERAKGEPVDEEKERREGPAVGIATRAFPLVKLLEEAAAGEADVLWGPTR
ncbi:MAG: DUF1840 domain-containing protein [Burkholderiales bacterium]|nr:DUF1840 domain-containing protein [Burkholderiales bacterium]